MSAPSTSPRWPERVIFWSRWLLYPVNVALILALTLYIGHFLLDDARFIWGVFFGSVDTDMEALMIMLLGFVDAAMVANLIVMIVMGSHQIFIQRFSAAHDETPQFLEHMDTGIQKVKVSLSIASITLIQLLKDFVHIESIPWEVVVHRAVLHGLTLASALFMAVIWRIMHPTAPSRH